MRKFNDIKLNNIKEDKKKIKLTKEEKQKLKEEKIQRKRELKEFKEANKQVLKSTKDELDFLDIDNDDSIAMKNRYIDIFQIDTKDIYSLSDEEVKMHIYNFIGFLRNYNYDFKIISMKFPVNTVKQQEHIRRKIKACNNSIYIRSLEEELKRLIEFENNEFDKEFYIMIFATEKDDKKEVLRCLFRSQNIAIRLIRMDLEKKLKILFKINNTNTKLTN
ncbi:MAG: hypothetical protein KH415_11270 [Clostridium sp.]|nr:hypothetical protein [Clostridium sp.]